MEQPVEQVQPEREQPDASGPNNPCIPCDDNEGTSIDNLPTDGSEVDPPPDEYSDSEQTQEAPNVPEPEPKENITTDPDKSAPLAEQERDSGLHVPPPSPNNGNTDNEYDLKIIVNDDEIPEIPDIPTPEKEDIVFVEQELEPRDQSTPIKNKDKKDEDKKEKKEREKREKKEREKELKEKKDKEKKERKQKEKKAKAEKKEEEETEILTSADPVLEESKPRRFRPNWSIPPVYK